MVKRSVSIIVLVAMILLAGCGSENQANSTSSQGQNGTTTEENGTSREDELVIENLFIEDYGSFYHINYKIRNNSGHYLDWAHLNFQLLDEQGDVIDDGWLYVGELEDGQAATDESQVVYGDGDLSKVSAIKFIGYDIHESTGINTSKTISEVKFSEPIIYKISDIEVQQK